MNIEFQIRKRPATLWMHAAVKAAAEAARNGADEAELAACFKPHARIAKRLLALPIPVTWIGGRCRASY